MTAAAAASTGFSGSSAMSNMAMMEKTMPVTTTGCGMTR